jgi:hypothetical protein
MGTQKFQMKKVSVRGKKQVRRDHTKVGDKMGYHNDALTTVFKV